MGVREWVGCGGVCGVCLEWEGLLWIARLVVWWFGSLRSWSLVGMLAIWWMYNG